MRKLFLCLCMSAGIACYAQVWDITSLDDSGSSTLREALAGYSAGDSIVFNSSLSGTILLEDELPEITAEVTIVGPSSNLVTIDGDNAYRILHINAPFSQVTISNLKFSDGVHQEQGGAIYIENGNLSLVECNFTLSETMEGINPIYCEADGYASLTDVTFTETSDSEIFSDGASIAFTLDNISAAYVIHGVNEGNIQKYGPNVMQCTAGANSVNLGSVVNEGKLILYGTFSAPANTLADSELWGEFTSQYIVNYGTVRPDNEGGMGTITVSEDYSQYEGSNLEIKIDDLENHDLVNCTAYGNLLGGNLTVIPASGSYVEGTKYVILTTGLGVVGTFENVLTGGLDIQVNYFSDYVELEIITSAEI